MVKSSMKWLASRVAPTAYEHLSLGRYANRWAVPPSNGEDEHFRPTRKLRSDAIDFRLPEQLARLEQWASNSNYRATYDALRTDDRINRPFHLGSYRGSGALHNGYFGTPDAEIYSSMIMDVRPQQIIEIGSGFSTLVARKTVELAGLDTRIRIIDPEPRTDVDGAADEVAKTVVEHSDLLGSTDWSLRTLLFIDSSHVCRSGGDLPYLFCEVLPSLPSGEVVHVHDIFLPYDYPSNYHRRLYTEQYLLHCLLTNTTRYRVLLATHFLSREHASSMAAAFGPRAASDPLLSGASFWFAIN